MPAEIPIIVLSGVLNCVPAAEFTSFIPSELAKATPKHFSRDLTCRADQKSAALYSTESTFIRKKKKTPHHHSPVPKRTSRNCITSSHYFSLLLGPVVL